jgi:tRNA nucleotidyltransferase (CCA-adding enzyme)
METYLVGGAIRDELLGLPVHEHDYVVVGATAAEMRTQGFRRVGRDFPVFLHPRTGAEYALARTERKSGPGHRGFEVQADPDVTLEDDLRRRDLTINAMARAPDGTLIDPYGGQRDLAARVLRHVSPAFAEDPLRILRVARFAARLAPLGFSVAPETRALMADMVARNMLAELPPERIWREWEKALEQTAPGAFFDVLENCGACSALWPELRWPPAGLPVWRRFLDFLAPREPRPPVRYAGLWSAARVSVTDHEAVVSHYRVPGRFADLADLALRALPTLPEGATASLWLAFLEQADALRRPARFEEFLALLMAWETFTDDPAPRSARLRAALQQVQAVSSQSLRETGLSGPELGAALRQVRLQILQTMLSDPATPLITPPESTA